MKCSRCGEEYSGPVCPVCGAQEPEPEPPAKEEVSPQTEQPDSGERPFLSEPDDSAAQQDAAWTSPAPSAAGEQQPIYPYASPAPQPPKKKGIKAWHILLIILGVMMAGAVALGVYVLLLPSTEDLLAQGEYEAAYNRAKADEKAEVLEENLVAYICKSIPEGMKNPSSFELRNAWCDMDAGKIVCEVGGSNSYGGIVTNLWYYTYDEEDGEYALYIAVSDLEEESSYSWDDFTDKLETWLENDAKEEIEKLMDEPSIKLNKAGVERINHMFQEGTLEDVECLPEAAKPLNGSAADDDESTIEF